VKLRPNQELARDFLRNADRGSGLFIDMGFGKTAATLSALEPRHLPALVVGPKRVCEHVWPAEQKLWRPDLSLALAAGTAAQRESAMASSADLVVVSRDNLANVNRQFKTVIIDESSSFKDRGTARWKMMAKLSKDSQHVWELTGTPSPNGYMDLWAQLFLLDRGERLGTSISRFRSRYFFPGRHLPNGTIIEWILRDESEANINAKIEDICLSMEISDEHLPDYNVIEVDLPAAARKHYTEFKRELTLNLSLLGGEVYTAANAAVLTNKLTQLASGFLYGDEGSGTVHWVHQEKLAALEEIVGGTGSPILVFYSFRPEMEAILKKFKQARHLDDPGAYEDWNKGKVPILLAHPASAAHGLNLQYGGHTAVWTSPTWNLEYWLQGNKRLARPGQKHPVTVHTIVARQTVDPYIMARLAKKTEVQEALRSYLESPI
jgi:SNF2 family DNA or RNA helicase